MSSGHEEESCQEGRAQEGCQEERQESRSEEGRYEKGCSQEGRQEERQESCSEESRQEEDSQEEDRQEVARAWRHVIPAMTINRLQRERAAGQFQAALIFCAYPRENATFGILASG